MKNLLRFLLRDCYDFGYTPSQILVFFVFSCEDSFTADRFAFNENISILG